MKSAILVFSFILSVSQGLHALPLRFLAWDDAVGARKLGVVSGKGVDTIVNLHPLKRSDMMNVTLGEGGLVVRALDRNSPDGKPLDFNVEKVTSFENPLVILFPDTKSPSGLRAMAVDDSNGNFPWGSFRLVNTTGKPLGLISGKTRKVIPADWAPLDLKGTETDALPIAIYQQERPQKAAYSALWSADAGIRRLVFIMNHPDDSAALALKVIVEDRGGVEGGGRP